MIFRERWKPVVGFEGSYEVSDHGRVRSLTREVRARVGRGKNPEAKISYTRSGQMLRPGPASHGYPTVVLRSGGRGKSFCIHTLVLSTFVGPAPKGKEALHKDGIKTNNRLRNLRWGTPKENAADTKRHGRTIIGSMHKTSKLTESTAAAIFRMRGKRSQKEIARLHNVSPSAVQAVHDQRTWTHVTKRIDSEA